MFNHPSYRLLPIFSGFFVACLIISNVANAAKFVQIGFLTIAGGTFIFPISFIFGDILTEVYGYTASRKVIWTGFASLILYTLFMAFMDVLPAPAFWQNQEAFDVMFKSAPRIILASMTAYFCGEFCNSVVLSKMKFFAEGKRGLSQAWRFIASTIVGEGVDTIVFVAIAFAGSLPFADLVSVGWGTYIVKVIIEVLMTPVSTRFSNWVKKVEGVDHIDTPKDTSYNPFVVSA